MLRFNRWAALWLCLSTAIACYAGVSHPAHAQEPAPAPTSAEAPAQPVEPTAIPTEAPPTEAPAPEAAPPTEAPPAVEAPAPAVPDVNALLQNPNLDGVQRLQLELLQLLNQRRAEAGRAPLALDERLVASATEHSRDMAARRFCRHGGSDGSSVRTRIARAGYPYNNWAGENIICGRKSAEAAMKWWMNSRPHRKNILHANYTHFGVGIDPNGPWGPMWTLNFAAGAADTARPTVYDVPDTAVTTDAPPAQEAPQGAAPEAPAEGG